VRWNELVVGTPAPGQKILLANYSRYGFLKRLSKFRRMSLGRVESGEAFRSTTTRSENKAHSFDAFLSTIRSGTDCTHSKRRPVSK
jgi:hypothetical protein